MTRTIHYSEKLSGTIKLYGDKSIAHRAALLNSMATGESHISNFCEGDDKLSMLTCLRGIGVEIEELTKCCIGAQTCLNIRSPGTAGLHEPNSVLYSGNSGTTMRLITGLLASQEFFSVISGDQSLNKRPMGRIIVPLSKMGAKITGRQDNSLPPLAIRGANLRPIEYHLPVASAQLKSCLLIAGANIDGQTTVHEPIASRDHTERMMKAMGANIQTKDSMIQITKSDLTATDIRVPGDTSSASFWIVAATCHPNASLCIKGVGLNPTRTGLFDVLTAMGANIRIENKTLEAGEPSGDVFIESGELKGIEISGELIPRVIDEIPILALAACFAKGKTIIRNAEELRLKESDRISCTVQELRKLGANVTELTDGMEIQGGKYLSGTECISHADHRISMTLGIAGLLSKGHTTIVGSEAASVSYPNFWDSLLSIQA